MADLSIFDKIKLFFNTAVSTPFFIAYAIVGLLLIVFMIADIKKHKKFSKIIYIISGIFLSTFFFVKYFSVILKIVDSFIEIVLKALYFPNLGIYIIMLIIINITFIYHILSKKVYKSSKVIASIITIIVDFIFIMIIGIISSEKIDITSDVKLYSDSTILTLLQISMALFSSLYILLGFVILSYRFRKYDKKINTFPKESVRVFKIIQLGGNND